MPGYTAAIAVTQDPPLPPAEFASRVGCPQDGDDAKVLADYDAYGSLMKYAIVDLLPPGWSFEGRSVLDFGSGAGRLLRHFVQEAETGEFYGSDIDEEMIGWLRDNLCPPVAGAFVNGEDPPIPLPDSSLDLIMAVSVFTHLTLNWATWLLEMRRLLKDDGLLVATFLGPGASRDVTPIPYDEDATAMNSFGFANPGLRWPVVLHSSWWLRSHWGRAFEIIELRPDGFMTTPGHGQGTVVMRPKRVSLTVEDLEREEPGEPRYEMACRQHLRQLATEGGEVRMQHQAVLRELSKVSTAYADVVSTRSWRYTEPLRRVRAALRRG